MRDESNLVDLQLVVDDAQALYLAGKNGSMKMLSNVVLINPVISNQGLMNKHSLSFLAFEVSLICLPLKMYTLIIIQYLFE